MNIRDQSNSNATCGVGVYRVSTISASRLSYVKFLGGCVVRNLTRGKDWGNITESLLSEIRVKLHNRNPEGWELQPVI